MEDTVELFIKTTFKNGRVYTDIKHPENQRVLSTRNMTHILTTAISLLIRSCTKYDTKISESDLIKEVIDHLNSEFISVDSYSDVKLKLNKK